MTHTVFGHCPFNESASDAPECNARQHFSHSRVRLRIDQARPCAAPALQENAWNICVCVRQRPVFFAHHAIVNVNHADVISRETWVLGPGASLREGPSRKGHTH